MLKTLFTFLVMLYAAVAFAAVDVNKATAAELDGIKGIGPSISGRIMEERKKGSFKDWNDFIERVKGVGEGSAAKFSSQGLTIGGSAYKMATSSTASSSAISTATPASAAADKKLAKADAKIKSDEAKAKKAADKNVKSDAKAPQDTKADSARPVSAASATSAAKK